MASVDPGGQSDAAFLPLTPARQKAKQRQWPRRLSAPPGPMAESGERTKTGRKNEDPRGSLLCRLIFNSNL